MAKRPTSENEVWIERLQAHLAIQLERYENTGYETARLRAALIALFVNHLKQGGFETFALPSSGRFLFYECEGLQVVSKEKKGARRADQNLGEALTWLREEEIIPWTWVVDETRNITAPFVGPTVKDWTMQAVPQARLDPWGGRPPLLLCESRSLSGILRGIAHNYAVPLASTNGMCQGFLRTDVAPILRPRQVVLYLGDLDLSGGQIEQNSRKILEDILVKLAWERLAITQEQVDQYELEPIQKWDERLHEYHPAVETEAIGQSLIVALVIDRLNVLLPEPLKAVLARQAAQIQAMDTRIRRMRM